MLLHTIHLTLPPAPGYDKRDDQPLESMSSHAHWTVTVDRLFRNMTSPDYGVAERVTVVLTITTRSAGRPSAVWH
jgi:hypothetical protein